MKPVNNIRWVMRTDMVLGKITLVFSAIGASFLLIMMLLIVADVVMRGFFNEPIRGIIESVGMALLLLVFLTLANVQYSKRNIAVNILADRLPKKARTVVAGLIYILTLCILFLLARQSFAHFSYQVETGAFMPVTRWPLPPFQFIVGFGWSFVCLIVLRDFLNTIFSFAKEDSQ
jgi:TRAP-type C4-dicarboxylate transport system permease small subunit